MQKEIELAIASYSIRNAQYIKVLGAKKLQVTTKRISGFHIRKRSIDARSKQVLYRVRVIFFIDEDVNVEVVSSSLQNVSESKPVIIIGAGAAGLFAADRCLELGLKPILLE